MTNEKAGPEARIRRVDGANGMTDNYNAMKQTCVPRFMDQGKGVGNLAYNFFVLRRKKLRVISIRCSSYTAN